MQNEKALIAMSGGVDSSVAAYLTIQQGFTCGGATMRLYGEDALIAAQIADAQRIAQRLAMPFSVMDCSDAFERIVIQDFIRSYEQGDTPNPCIVCNQHLKFGIFLEEAKHLGYDYIVTGHYARIHRDPSSGRFLLKKALDETKDQSYFLASLTQEQLSHTLFPLGQLTKQEARQIAEEKGFINAKKRDSQDICFVPDGDYTAFIRKYTGKTYPCGHFLDTAGNVVGQHCGAICYTLGQRKGLGLAMGQPVYVCGKDMQNNTVTVGLNSDLFNTTLLANNWNWISIPELTQPLRVLAKARSRMAAQPATVIPEANGVVRVVFDQPQRALTPGQAVVLYDDDVVIAGGTITEIITK